ncbi:SigB/SigF/SigG family RNA polymerase sigma factor [Asanoa sp. NPDC049573]|uniref:SigB/SigF/SigG family RNA polymerase sigma factor n=1 Tax=Asanoa sp. NPDC049573 TaxID=3155396 RepID=UPI003427302D
MTLQSGMPASGELDLPALDAVAMSYAQRSGDDARRLARERLVRSAMPFAGRLARRYRGRGEPMDDLEQVARLGLLKAVDRFDPERGAFTGFAAATIIGELRRHFRDRTWGVHVPRRMQELSIEVNRASTEMTARLRRSPTVPELAERLRVDEDDVLAALETAAAYTPLSLNMPARAESEAELGDLIGGADVGLEAVDDRLTVASLLCRLPERERRILALRFYGNKTQTEIATELGISQMHVSRLLSRALAWLREAMLSDAPKQWQAGTGPGEHHEITVQRRDRAGLVRLDVAGEVDRDTADPLRAALLDAVEAVAGRPQPREVAVSLAGVPIIDAAGVSALLAGLEAARAAGVRLRIGDMQVYVRRTLRVAGLNPIMSAPHS